MVVQITKRIYVYMCILWARPTTSHKHHPKHTHTLEHSSSCQSLARCMLHTWNSPLLATWELIFTIESLMQPLNGDISEGHAAGGLARGAAQLAHLRLERGIRVGPMDG